MAKESFSSFHELVFDWDESSFNSLKNEVSVRECSDRLESYDLSGLVGRLGRKPGCPGCGCEEFQLDGKDASGERVYVCRHCDRKYSLLSKSFFPGSKKHFKELLLYIRLMFFSVPLDLLAGIVGITNNTALLWRRKIFSMVDGYQSKAKLSGRVWIDGIYTYDASIKRGALFSLRQDRERLDYGPRRPLFARKTY